MQRFIITIAAALTFLCAAGFTTGVFTPEVRREEGCALCRAIRYSGSHYGFGYERVEASAMTDWYRRHVDPLHGLDPLHPHVWERSACTQTNHGGSDLDYDCEQTPPVFLIRPEVERAVLEQIPDRDTQLAVIRSLNDPDRATSERRARRLIEFYYVLRERATWQEWWQQYAPEFGLTPPTPTAPMRAAPVTPLGHTKASHNGPALAETRPDP